MRPYLFGRGLVFLIGLNLLTGCGGDGKPVRVTGVVRAGGKPVPNLVVHFVPEQGRESTGITDENGAFGLKYERDVEGALRGKHKVFVEYRPRDARQEADLAAGKAVMTAEMKALVAKYGKQTSTLSYEVTKNGQEIPIDLD